MTKQGSAREVFRAFLVLGLTSFGGPIAHLGYFRDAFVEKRKWLSDRAYADLVALCQLLPGPASSQVGMALGLQRAGYAGMFAAWFAFTMPSALLMVGFAYGLEYFAVDPQAGWVLGLKAAAVAVVANAVLAMARSLAPDRERATIAVGAMILALLIPWVAGQVAVIVVAALVGLFWLKAPPPPMLMWDRFNVRVPRWVAVLALLIFAGLLIGLPLLASTTNNLGVDLADIFYRAGSLVFGGGHVVLPLLQSQTSELVSHDLFLAGYGAAQAVPGPLFTFAAYLGAETGLGLTGAVIALVAIFLPSALLIIGSLPFWEQLRHAPKIQRALMGVNAGVVGLLAAALYTPVFTEGIPDAMAMIIAAAAFVALASWKTPAWAVVIAAGALGYFVL
ncbi:MAG: chromate efflux transporter [Nocardiaceae bacterium]|nr:chromate efflux transporter [Nocardiaceae bacterium]